MKVPQFRRCRGALASAVVGQPGQGRPRVRNAAGGVSVDVAAEHHQLCPLVARSADGRVRSRPERAPSTFQAEPDQAGARTRPPATVDRAHPCGPDSGEHRIRIHEIVGLAGADPRRAHRSALMRSRTSLTRPARSGTDPLCTPSRQTRASDWRSQPSSLYTRVYDRPVRRRA